MPKEIDFSSLDAIEFRAAYYVDIAPTCSYSVSIPMPTTPEGRLDFIRGLMSNRDPVTGRFISPLITKKQALELLNEPFE